ncbi:uncharacterized protein LOC131596888 [Vicia villosa]|uniref:uncharacterized protein LOC131596888 n=1 Tax=Vicia villosa TaxID=3911 RepID=UPI00273C9A1A|nr:uncharacterized protein LOC131596888 [Vicia villosa]
MNFLKNSWAALAEEEEVVDSVDFIDNGNKGAFSNAISNFKKKAKNTMSNQKYANNSSLPSLWCFCKLDINPTLLASSNQYVAFSFDLDGKFLASTAVYASNNMYRRKVLWDDLVNLLVLQSLPWSFCGDFNAIIGDHEHSGSHVLAKGPMRNFQVWTDANQLIHVPKKGALFTWSNKMSYPFLIERRLDRVIVNRAWLDLCVGNVVCTLTKLLSDHFPLLFEFSVSSSKAASQFRFLKTWMLHKDCEKLIADCWNHMVAGCPLEVIDRKLKILKKELQIWNLSCFGNVTENMLLVEEELNWIQSGSVGAGGNFNILEKEAQNRLSITVDMEESFWKEKSRIKWHLEGDRNDVFFTVWLKFDCFMVDDNIPCMVTEEMNKMLTILPSLAEIKATVFALNADSAPDPNGFGALFYHSYWEIIQHDVAAAVVNADSLDLFRPIAISNFKFKIISKIIAVRLADVMPQFYIVSISMASSVSGLIVFCNLAGFLSRLMARFTVSLTIRGVRQGDPLSLFLLCLTEEVLGRLISKMVLAGSLSLIRGPNNIKVPSHLFYANDVCKGSVANIKSLIKVFKAYEVVSGQSVNCSKSSIFGSAICQSRLNILSTLSGFDIGNSSLIYLGVPIFKGKPRSKFLLPISDNIILKLASWKGSLLSFTGRVELVKSSIQSMLIHSMSIYD